MKAETIRRLFQYRAWAHARLWESVMPLTDEEFTRDLGYSWGTIQRQLVHIMSAEWVWITRLNGETPTSPLDFDEYPTRETLREKWDEVAAQVWAYIDALEDDDLDRPLSYTTVRGQQYTNRVVDILLHVVNHGTDHRAQVFAMIGMLGGQTPNQDLIYYLRGTE